MRMQISRSSFFRCLIALVTLGPVLSPVLLPPMAARADMETDFKRPLALLKQEKFAEGLKALNAIAPRYQNEFLLHYLTGITQMALVDGKGSQAKIIGQMRQARTTLLRARKLAGTDKESVRVANESIRVLENGLREIGVPFDAPSSKPAKPTPSSAVRPATVKPAAVKPATSAKLSPRPGFFIGRAVDANGKPLPGVGIRVFGTTMAGEKTNFETKTNASGLYSVKLPPGNYHLGWAHYFTPAPSGPAYALPLHPLDGSNDDQNSAPGIVENLVLKITGLISPKKDRENELSYYGGYITVEGGALENGDFLSGYSYKFPQGAEIELTLTPKGKLADGSNGQILTLRRPTERGYIAEFRDVPIGQYEVTAQLIEVGGKVTPLRIAPAKPMSGTSPIYQTPAYADFKSSGTIYFPSRGDSIPLLTYGGAAKAPLYVQP